MIGLFILAGVLLAALIEAEREYERAARGAIAHLERCLCEPEPGAERNAGLFVEKGTPEVEVAKTCASAPIAADHSSSRVLSTIPQEVKPCSVK